MEKRIDSSEMQEYLDIAKAVAREAGGFMLDSFGIGTPHTFKDDYTPLTDVDKKVNDHVLTRLSAAFPDHSFLGEEGTRITESKCVWIFDPIDGTAPYFRGIPTNVFSLALVDDGEPIVGVVYDPYMDRLYSAVKGGGAFINDRPMRTSTHTELSRTYIETDHHKGFKDLFIFQRLLEADVRFLSYSSTVYADMLVASGQIQGVVFPADKPWDAAAAKVIVEEAGGMTSDLQGHPQRYDDTINGFICACTPEYHAKLLAIAAPSL